MSIQSRRERERAEREKLIVTAARELVEAEGWEAMTTRRLAEQVEYSQPVLYSHFRGKDAIMAAVAVEGFTDLAEELSTARATTTADEALAAVARAYLSFADRRPALYDAMFSRAVDLPFATAEAPAPLKAGFNELAEAIRPHTGAAEDQGLLTETFWAALHGLITLTRGARLPREAHDRRLALLLARFTGVRH
jgi:AcrR family transcriptional regulator